MKFSDKVANLPNSDISDMLALSTQNNVVSFAGGMPENRLLPVKQLEDIFMRLTHEEKQTALQYSPTNGLPTLLESLGEHLKQKGLPVSTNKIMITTGASQAINILAKTLVDNGDAVVVEYPCFIGGIATFKSYGAQMISVPVEHGGAKADVLARKLDESPVLPKLCYFTPNFHNPAGTLYTKSAKSAILDVLAGRQIPVIEDDVYSDLYFFDEDKEHLPSLKSMNRKDVDVCYVGSFSKIMGPGLRLGWMLVPEEIYEKCVLVKQTMDACSPAMSQVLADKYLRAGMVQSYTSAIRQEYKRRAALMSDMLESGLSGYAKFERPRGGFYIWLTLPSHIKSSEVLIKTIEKGAAFMTGKSFDPHETNDSAMRLSYCGTTMEEIERGLPIIIESIKQMC